MNRLVLGISGLMLAVAMLTTSFSGEPVIRKTYDKDGKCSGWIMQKAGTPMPMTAADESVVEGPVTEKDKADMLAAEDARKADRMIYVLLDFEAKITAAQKIEATTTNAALKAKVVEARLKLEEQAKALTDSVK